MKRNKENAYRIVLATGMLLSGCRGVLPGTYSQESPAPEASPTPSLKLTDTATPTVTPYPELTVTPTEEVVPGSEVSRFFPPAFYRETKGGTIQVGEVTLNVPISLGITKKLTEREKYPIPGFELNTDDDAALEALTMLYFKVFYEIYKDQKKTPELTLEEYAQLVANGEGKIRVYAVDEATAVDKYDRDWYEVSIIDGIELEVGDLGEFSAHNSQATYYIGINEGGSLVLGVDMERNAWAQHKMNPWEQSPVYALAADNSSESILTKGWYLSDMMEYGAFLDTGHQFKSILIK